MAFVTPAPFAYLSSQGASISYFISASGGTITYDGDYKIHTFTNTGSNTFTVFTTGSSPFNTVELLLVGGGGGGGNDDNPTSDNFWVTGGGGGAGGLIYTSSLNISVGDLTVNIGNGGAPGPLNSTTAGSTGGNTSFNSLIAYGGQGGNQAYSSAPNVSGSSGGLQGQPCGIVRFGGNCNSGTCTYVAGNGSQPNGFANDGGPAWSCVSRPTWVVRARGAGGGGAGGNGLETAGGAGLSYTISGTSVVYAKGGDALTNASYTKPANVGYGGDAGYDSSGGSSNATSGSSGVTIIKYRYQ
jgi:hypothetical protein